MADRATFADHFAIVELIKPTTANERELTRAHNGHTIEEECPKWLLEQLRRWESSMLIVTGNRGKRLVAPRLLNGRRFNDGITMLHATSHKAQIGAIVADMYLSVAFSSSARGTWNAVFADTKISARHAQLLSLIRAVIQQRNQAVRDSTKPS